jgi:hypothetical protein
LLAALKGGRTFASNGPLLGLELNGKHPGGAISLKAPGALHYSIALRSPVAVQHLELVENGEVVKAFALTGDRRKFDAEGEVPVSKAGWLLLRAWNDGSDPEVLDIYPYATTSPVYVDMPGGLPPDRTDAAYFVRWLDRVIVNASARDDYRNARERDAVVTYLTKARAHYAELARER